MSSNDEAWNRSFRLLVRFKAEHGHIDIPKTCNDPDLIQLMRWMKWQKSFREAMRADRRKKLESIGLWLYPTDRESCWMATYDKLIEYVKTHRDIPRCNGALGFWVSLQRKQKRQGKLLARREALLNRIEGFVWEFEAVVKKRLKAQIRLTRSGEYDRKATLRRQPDSSDHDGEPKPSRCSVKSCHDHEEPVSVERVRPRIAEHQAKGEAVEAQSQSIPIYPVGTRVWNFCPGRGWYTGKIEAVDEFKYTVVFDGDDIEDYGINNPIIHVLVELATSHPDIGRIYPSTMAKAKCTSKVLIGGSRVNALKKDHRTAGENVELDPFEGTEVRSDESEPRFDASTVVTRDKETTLKTRCVDLENGLERNKRYLDVAPRELKNVESVARRKSMLNCCGGAVPFGTFVAGSVAQKVQARLQQKIDRNQDMALWVAGCR